jgi:cation:H+ antiporter
MGIVLYLGLFVVSLAVLLKAADWFIDSAEEIGLSLGISPFIIGVTIIAFGTSLPELATSMAAVFAGTSEIVIGNVVGSNITNIALVLGLTVVVSKEIKLHNQIWHVDMPFLLSSAFLMWFLVRDANVSIFEAIIFLGALALFLIYSLKSDEGDDDQYRKKVSWKSYAWLVVGGALVWLGAEYTIQAITKLSDLMGIDSEIIALSLVALGTSLPEVIVSLGAARKGKTSIAVGNVLGSNIFNTFAVMGIPSFFGKLIIPQSVLDFSLPLMIVMTILFAVMTISRRITRWEGIILLIFYVFYMVELFTK